MPLLVLGAKPVAEAFTYAAPRTLGDLPDRRRAIVWMNELEHRLAAKLLRRPAENRLPAIVDVVEMHVGGHGGDQVV